MTKATVLLKNLGRNKLRTTLTVVAIALPMLVFTVSRSFVDAIDEFFAESDRNLRVAVHQKVTYTAPMPQRIKDEILQLAPPGYVTAICRTSWFGGHIEGKQASFPSMGVDRDTFPVVYSEFRMSPDDIAAFQKERRGAIIGSMLANQQNWKIGDRVTLKGQLPPYPVIEFVIVAIPPGLDSPWFYFALDYYDEKYREATGNPVSVNNFWLKCASPEAREWALREIDKHFANTEYETRTEMESTFVESFVKSQGDWVGMIWNIGRLIVLVAVAVAFNTMSMSFRERTREIAVLRALGFSAGRIVRMVLAEGVALGLLGGLIAVAPIYTLTTAQDISVPGTGRPIRIAETTAAIALLVAVGCGFLAALLPAVLAGRLKVAAALRKVA